MATTIWVPIDFRNPQVSTNPGSVYFNVAAPDAFWDAGHWVFDKTTSLDVKLYGLAYVPHQALSATPNAKIILSWVANSTASQNLHTKMSFGLVKNNNTTNDLTPGALTTDANSTVTVAMGANAYKRIDTTYPSSGTISTQPAVDDWYIVEVTRIGSSGSDTLAVNGLLFAGFLQIDLA